MPWSVQHSKVHHKRLALTLELHISEGIHPQDKKNMQYISCEKTLSETEGRRKDKTQLVFCFFNATLVPHLL